MNPATNVSLYLHDKHVLDGSLKSKSTSDLFQQHQQQQLQQQQLQLLPKQGNTTATSSISTNKPTLTTLQIPKIITSSASNENLHSPASSPLLKRASFLSGLSGNPNITNSANKFHLNGRKRSISHSEFSNFYDWWTILWRCIFRTINLDFGKNDVQGLKYLFSPWINSLNALDVLKCLQWLYVVTKKHQLFTRVLLLQFLRLMQPSPLYLLSLQLKLENILYLNNFDDWLYVNWFHSLLNSVSLN